MRSKLRSCRSFRLRASITRELDNLTKLRIRDILSDEEYLKQREELDRRQIANAQQIEAFKQNDNRFEPGKSVIAVQ